LAPRVSESVHEEVEVSVPQTLIVGEPATLSEYVEVLLSTPSVVELLPERLDVSLSVSWRLKVS